jgi:hypothetical protein
LEVSTIAVVLLALCFFIKVPLGIKERVDDGKDESEDARGPKKRGTLRTRSWGFCEVV